MKELRRELFLIRGDFIQKLIRLGIRGAIVVYRKNWKSEIGNLNIYFKDSLWKIGYEFESLSYFPPGYRLSRVLKIYSDYYFVSSKGKWEIRDHGCDFKVFTHEESEVAEELIGEKVTKSITKPDVTLEYYKRDKILKIPFFNDEIRIFIKNENLEYIRNNKKIVKVFPLNKEIHFYGIKPEVWRYIVTPKGEELISKEIGSSN